MTNKQQQIDDAWLGITVDESKLFNPMDFVMADGDKDKLIERISWLMMRPEYFSFAAKYVLNIELSPFQCLILEEMWNKKFPMLIGSRGLGKAIAPETPILTPSGWSKIQDLHVGDFVIGSDGKSTKILNKTDLQKSLNFYRLTLMDGRTIECCEDHLWKVWDRKNEQEEWSVLSTKELSSSYYKDIKNKKNEIPRRYKEYRYALPVNAPIQELPEKKLPLHPYIVGLLIGNGHIDYCHSGIYTRNKKVLKKCQELLPDDYFIKFKKAHRYNAIIGPSNRTPSLHTLLKKSGINCEHFSIPEEYLFSSTEQRLELLRGIVDSVANEDDTKIEYKTKYYNLHCQIQDLVRSLGISCQAFSEDPSLYSGRTFTYYKILIYGTRNISYLIPDDKATDHPDKILITNIEKIGKKDGMCIAVDNEDRTYITKDYIVTHNSFLLSVYSVLRALFMPRRKIIIVGAAFRQSKVIFEYMDTIWKNAPVLRDLSSNNSGPRRDVDRCVMYLNDSTITALPLGDGQKIRGQRANDIIADEFACLGRESLIQTDAGLIKIEDYLKGDAYDLVNMNKELETPDRIFKTPKVDVYKVTTQNGYSFRCSSIHQAMTSEGWKKCTDLTKNDWLELEFSDYFPSQEIKNLDSKTAWLMGLLVSEGSVTNRNFISMKNTDKKLIDKIKSNIDLDWKEYHKDSYLDPRGWKCNESWELKYNNTEYRDMLKGLGIDYVISHDKEIPSKILQSPKHIVKEFLSGLYEGDGSAFNYYESNKKRVGLSYYSVSKKMIDQLQILLLKFGIITSQTEKKSKISKSKNYMLSARGENAKKLYDILNINKWKDKFDKIDFFTKKPTIRKNGKRFVVSTYKNNKNYHVGTFDTEEECKQAFEKFWTKHRVCMRVKSVEKLDDKEHLFDFHMPKTNSFIGNGFVQHNSIPRDIFENVVAGFAAVSASPIDKVKHRAKIKKAKELGIKLETDLDEPMEKSNQIILSGTAYYDFNHFADYWRRYKLIVNSKGDPNLLKDVFGEEPSPEFNWKEYSVIRMPVDKLPEGFMDEGQIARAKATIHSGIYNMEYSACFTTDSQGFFKRSLLESCTASMLNPIVLSSGEVNFGAMLKGDPKKKYIFGVDPASEVDNFSIVIIELNEDHRRIVYSWTTTRQQHKAKLKSKLVDEDDFYSYCAKKIRSLMRVFPCIEIAIDTQGGGIAVIEALHDKDKMQSDEVAIWPTVDENKEKDTDDNPGLHILKLCQFAKADWLAEANHGLRKDFEDKVLLFPFFDSASIGVSIEEDKAANRVYDTLEDCVMEIEELKDELSMIVMTQTSNGRERWDTPEVKVAAGKKSRLRKDRYSSLLMANMSARVLSVEKQSIDYGTIGGFAVTNSKSKFDNSKLYNGPNWFTDKIQDVY